MGSEQNEGTSFPPAEPKLCANGCGFFGTAASMNLCSKCYRDLRVEEEQAASAKAAMEKSLNPKPKLQDHIDTRKLESAFSAESFGFPSSSSVVSSSKSSTPIVFGSAKSSTAMSFGSEKAVSAMSFGSDKAVSAMTFGSDKAVSAMTFGSDKPAPKVVNRCECCNKKVGLTGFHCKCGSTFCGNHRYPEKHNCDFDFKGAGRDAIAKANPVVKADKVERI